MANAMYAHETRNETRKPFRSKSYLDHIRAKNCIVCLAQPPSQAHHVILTGGWGSKGPDSMTLPLCGNCHEAMENHPKYFKDRVEQTLRLIVDFMSEYMGEQEATVKAGEKEILELVDRWKRSSN